jgi:hypothetical protein
MSAWQSSRARVGVHVAAALGVACLMPLEHPSPLAFAFSPAGLAIAAVLATLAGESVEESGTARRIRAGLVIRLIGTALVAGAIGWVVLIGVGVGAVGLGATLAGLGFAGSIAFSVRDGRVLQDLRFGQRISLRAITAKRLELDAAGSAIGIPLASVLGVAIAKTATRRGLMIAIEADAKIDGPARDLPWVEERVRSRKLFLDEYQLGDDADAAAKRVARAQAIEGGYR